MNNKKTGSDIFDLIPSHFDDYTAESIAASLIKKGVPPEHIILKSNGTSKRSHKRDVTVNTVTIDDNDSYELFILESPREGIYDTLPESLFHSFSGKNEIRNKLEVIEEIKRHREEEKHARNFFLPFEQEFFNIKQILSSFEDQFEWLSNASNLIDIYRDYYPILDDLKIEKGYLFVRLLPLIHDIRDDFNKVELCLTMLLDLKVEISVSFKKNKSDSHLIAELGFATLGIDTTLGSCIEDGEPDLNISLTPIHHSEAMDYLFFERQENLTRKLCSFFIGAQYDISISYAFYNSSHGMSMNERSILGYNVYL